MAYGKVVLLGDSLTQQSFAIGGWGARLADHLQRRADVINRGFSGYTTRWVKEILSQVFPASAATPQTTVVFLGANDSALPGKESKQHVPLAEYKSSLKDICSYFISNGFSSPKSLILIAPPPVSLSQWLQVKECELNRENSNTVHYVEAVKQVGEELKVTVLDFFAVITNSGYSIESCLSDGLHLSERGSELLAQHLIPLVDKKMEVKENLYSDWTQLT